MESKKELTPTQEKVLNFLKDFLREKGFPPTLREIASQVTPKQGTRGLLIPAPSAAPKDPGDDVMIYGISLDVVF